MLVMRTNLDNWPVGLFGDPILRNTEDALTYASLIFKLSDKQDFLNTLRNRVRKSCDALLKEKDPDYDLISSLACLSQFYRECLEECKRLQEEKA